MNFIAHCTAMCSSALRKFGESLHYKRLPSVREVAFCTEKHDQKNPFGTKGALLYSPDGSTCALRGRQPGQPNVRAVLRRVAPYKGVPPLRCHSSYPSALCSGNSLLAQTIPAAKSENPISSHRPSTENVGGLFASIYPIIYQSGGQNHARKRN